MHQTTKCIVYVTVLFDVVILDYLCYIYKLYYHDIIYQGYVTHIFYYINLTTANE